VLYHEDKGLSIQISQRRDGGNLKVEGFSLVDSPLLALVIHLSIVHKKKCLFIYI
jgi:hypothetical protein